jgi:alkylated DNA repair dioxygenase AlkB
MKRKRAEDVWTTALEKNLTPTKDKKNILQVPYKTGTVTIVEGLAQATQVVDVLPPFLYKELIKFLHTNKNLCEQRTMKMFGKDITLPRQQRNFGRGYTYSGVKNDQATIPDTLNKVLKWVNALLGCEFTDILVNEYLDGDQYIGPHSDDERGLEEGYPIAGLTIGHMRRFLVQHKKNKELKYEFGVGNNSLLVMHGSQFQKLLKHSVPKQKSAKYVRYSLTFRNIIE